MNNNTKISRLIDLSKRRIFLLKKMQRSKEISKKKYHLIQPLKARKHFMLIDIKTGCNLVYGTTKRIKSYLRLRKIDSNKVMDIHLIK